MVVDQEAQRTSLVLHCPTQLAGLLHDPGCGGMPRAASQMDPSRSYLDKEQDVDRR
jgi:hypothetical protein